MSRGVKVSLAEKADLVEWIITGKGSKSAWAKKHNRAAETVSRILDDPEFKELWAAAERGQEQRRAYVVEQAYKIIADTDHMRWGKAADFLSKIHGWYKPEKIEATVSRVAYVEPSALADVAVSRFPELRN